MFIEPVYPRPALHEERNVFRRAIGGRSSFAPMERGKGLLDSRAFYKLFVPTGRQTFRPSYGMRTSWSLRDDVTMTWFAHFVRLNSPRNGIGLPSGITKVASTV